VQHSAHSAELSEPWRTRAIVAAAIAAVELALLLGVGAVLLGRVFAKEVEQAALARVVPPAKPDRPEPKVGAPKLARSETSVFVLNGNGISGAAGDTGRRVRGLGYVVGGVGNAPRSDYGRSVVMFRRGYEPEARRLAKDVGIKVVGPLDGLRARDLMGAQLALVVGN
jgi:LytR cell envelope-related transcriptional attenuator